MAYSPDREGEDPQAHLQDFTGVILADGFAGYDRRPLSAAMAEKFKSAVTPEAYRRRKWLSKPPDGWVNNVLEFRRFNMRSLLEAQTIKLVLAIALWKR